MMPPLSSEGRAHVWRDGKLVADAEPIMVGEGEMVVLVGDNGAGKSSLLLGALGVLPSTLIATGPVGYAPQTLPVLATAPLSVGDVLSLLKVDSADHTALVDDAHLSGGLSRSFSTCTPGERARLSVARALWGGSRGTPRLVLLDEPFASLDDDARARVVTAIDKARGHGTAVVVVAHDDVLTSSGVGARVVRVTRPASAV